MVARKGRRTKPGQLFADKKVDAALREKSERKAKERDQKHQNRNAVRTLGPKFETAFRRASAEVESEKLSIPVATVFDLHGAVSRLREKYPRDLGLERAFAITALAYQKGGFDATVNLTDVDALTSKITRDYPKSRIAALRPELAEVSFAKLRIVQGANKKPLSLQQLVRIGLDVKKKGGSQEEFERAIEAAGLDGSSVEMQRARALVASMATLSSDKTDDGSWVDGLVAQILEDEETLDDDDSADEVGAIDDTEGTVVSPHSGEPVAVELSSGTPETSTNVETESLESLPPIPEHLEVTAQLDEFRDVEPLSPIEPPPEPPPSSATVIDDPTSPGDQILVTVTPAVEATPEDVPPAVESLGGPSSSAGLGGGDLPVAPAARAASREVCTYEVFHAFPTGQRKLDEFTIPSRDILEAVRLVASNLEGGGTVYTSSAAPYAIIDQEQNGQVHIFPRRQRAAAVSAVTPTAEVVEPTRLRALGRAEIDARCIAAGLTPAFIEEEIIGRAATLTRCGWSISVDDEDRVWVRPEEGTLRGKKAEGQRYGLSQADDAIARFRALVARTLPDAQGIRFELDVPGKEDKARKMTAQKIVAAVKKIAEPIQSTFETPKLAMTFVSPSEGLLRGVRSVLQDGFGVRAFEAQYTSGPTPIGSTPAMVSRPGQPTPAPVQPVPLQPGTPPNSPFVGPPPSTQTPAGQPMAPMQAPQQTMATGSAAQAAYIDRALDVDPTKPRAAGRRAQLADEMMPMAPGAPLANVPIAAPLPTGGSLADAGAGGVVDPLAAGASSDVDDSIRAAFVHYRDLGMFEMGAIAEFVREYKPFLERFGPQGSPGRRTIEQKGMAIHAEIFSKPAVVDASALAAM